MEPHSGSHTSTTTLFLSPDLVQLHFLKSLVILEGVSTVLMMLTRSVGLHIGLLIFLVSVEFGWDLNTGLNVSRYTHSKELQMFQGLGCCSLGCAIRFAVALA